MWSHFDQSAIGAYVLQAILILVAPALFAASVYMTLGRLVRSLGAEAYSVVPPRWLTRVFVAGDVVSFALQAGGGGVQAGGTLELYGLGEKVIIAGLWAQIVIFGFFVATAVLFHLRLVRARGPAAAADPTTEAQGGAPGEVKHGGSGVDVAWERHLRVLYAASGLILVRSVFRVDEYLQGNGGYLISREVFLYVFDALLMALVMLVLAVWYVGNLGEEKGPRGKTELAGMVEMGVESPAE